MASPARSRRLGERDEQIAIAASEIGLRRNARFAQYVDDRSDAAIPQPQRALERRFRLVAVATPSTGSLLSRRVAGGVIR